MNSFLLPLAMACSAGFGATADLPLAGSYALGATQSSFKLLRQPEKQSKSEGELWGQIVVQIPASLQATSADSPLAQRSAIPKQIGTAFLNDADGHRVSIGTLYQPAPGQTTYTFLLPRGYTWHWSHPRLELELSGQQKVTLKLRDLPEKEMVNLPESSLSQEFTCEAVPNLQSAGIFGEGFDKPNLAVPGFIVTPVHPFQLGPGEKVEAILSATDSLSGVSGMRFILADNASSKPGSFFLPYTFAETTKVARVAFRRVKKGVEYTEVAVPGCKLVSKFGGTGFELDHDVSIAADNGWTVKVPTQYSGPFRDVKTDTKTIDIRCEAVPPTTMKSDGTYDDQAVELLRRWDADMSKQNWGLSLVSPTPAEVGLNWVQIRGNHFTSNKSDAPVKYGEFTMKLKLGAYVTKELSLEGYTLKDQPAH